MTKFILMKTKLSIGLLIFITFMMLSPGIGGNYNDAVYRDELSRESISVLGNPYVSIVPQEEYLVSSAQDSDALPQKLPITDTITIELATARKEIDIYRTNGWDMVNLEGYDYPSLPGMPALPMRSVNVLVPADAARLTLEVIEKDVDVLTGEYSIHGVPQPQPIGTPGEPEPLTPPVIQNRFTLDFAMEGYLRGFRIVTYQYYPIHLNPRNELEVITYLKFKLTYTPGTLPSRPLPEHSTFRKMLEDQLENPQDIDHFAPKPMDKPTGALTTEDIKYVIVTNSSIVGAGFDTLNAWKTKKGVPAKIVEVSWIESKYTGNDTQEKIRNFLKDAVATWGIEYCLLGGDISVVPYRSCWALVPDIPEPTIDPYIAADIYYSDLDGNFDANNNKTYGEPVDNVDLHPDIIVGRASVQTAGEVLAFVYKTLAYIKNPPDNYILNATFAGEFLDSITNSSISLDQIKNNILPPRYISTSLFDAGWKKYYNLSKLDFRNVTNRGSGLIFHSGHSNHNVMGMGSPREDILIPNADYSWYKSDVNGLTNGYKMGVLYSLGCITTKFTEDDCIAEYHVKYDKDGTVAFIGNSQYGWYTPGSPGNGPSERYMKSMATEIFANGNVRIGESFAAGKDTYTGWSGGNNSYRWLQYVLTLIGEPEMYIWTDIPKNFTVTHPAGLFYGTQTIPIQVNNTNNTPVENALVCVQNTNNYKYGLTDENGNINFQINITTSDMLNVTVTKHNYYPYESNITKEFVDENPPVMIIDKTEYGWYNADPGNVILVTFDSGGETDLSKAEYSLTPTGPWFEIFNTPHPVFTTPWNISALWESLPEGDNQICIRCNDSADPNHWVMGNITIKKDTSPPSVLVNTASYGWFISDPGASYNVDFFNDSTGSPLGSAEYSINSVTGPWYNIFTGPVAQYIDNWPVKWSKLDDGDNTIYIRLFDEAGNEDNTNDMISIKRDTLPPIIIIRKSVYGWYSTDPKEVINIDFSNGGNGSLLDFAQYKIGETGSWDEIFSSDTQDFNANWAVSWSALEEGTNTIFMRCFDQVGFKNDTAEHFTILKDTTAPQIIINKHIYGWYTTDPGNIIDVDITIGNPDSSSLSYGQYRVYPEQPPSIPGPWRMIFNAEIDEYKFDWSIRWFDLQEGNNTIEIQVFDLASNHNATIDTVYFLKDTSPPVIIINKERYGWYNSDPGAVIDVDFDNDGIGSDLDYAEYRVNGGVWYLIRQIDEANYLADWSVNWLVLGNDENFVEVRVWDAAGLSTTQTIRICKDTILPLIEINKEEYGWYGTDPNKVIDVDFFSSSSGLVCSELDCAEYKIGVDGEWVCIFDTDFPSYSAPWAVNWSALPNGVSDIFIRATDLANNTNEWNIPIKFKKDTLAPSITINKQVYGWYNTDPGNILDVDFSKLPEGSEGDDQTNHSLLASAQYMVEGIGVWANIFTDPCETNTIAWNVSWDMLVQGRNNIHIRVFDIVGNVYYDPSNNITILNDHEAPNIIFNKREYGWYNADPGPVIDIDFDAGTWAHGYDRNSPLKTAQYKIGAYGKWTDIVNFDGTGEEEVFHFEDNWSISWGVIHEGVNYILLRIFDAAGNVYEPPDEINFKCDTIGPDITKLISPVDQVKTTDTTPQHRWIEPNDPSSNLTVKYQIRVSLTEAFLQNIVDTETSWATFKHTTKLPIGKYHWQVRGIDIAGNYGSWSYVWAFEIVTFDSDEGNLPPVADAGKDMVVMVNEVVWFDGSRSMDPENDKLSFLWYLYGGLEPDAIGESVNWTYSIAGVYPVILEVFDEFGGGDNDTIVITVLDISNDSDSDGIPDAWEEYYGLDPTNPKDALGDLDNDGYVNSMEFALGSSPSNAISTPVSVLDDSPPEITHTKVRYGKVLVTIRISAMVTDDSSGIKEVNLYYKKKTDRTYNSISMGEDNPYYAKIPASMATLDDLEYYIEAVDNAKKPNIAYFGTDGVLHKRPSHVNDIDINIQEDYRPPEDSNMAEDFIDTFGFDSAGICFLVIVIIVILIVSFAFSLRSAIQARDAAHMKKRQRTVRVMHGKDMLWEGFELENISEDEDLYLINDDFELDEI